MKRTMMVLMAAAMFTTSMPAFAMSHGNSHDPADVQCAKDCAMLLKDCSREVDSIQQRIKKLQAEINKVGADQKTADELRVLNAKLKDANQTLNSLNSPGH
jgi:peptidoglycan hydrolase CwlO-like protein